jgi:hypothetical protein
MFRKKRQRKLREIQTCAGVHHLLLITTSQAAQASLCYEVGLRIYFGKLSIVISGYCSIPSVDDSILGSQVCACVKHGLRGFEGSEC